MVMEDSWIISTAALAIPCTKNGQSENGSIRKRDNWNMGQESGPNRECAGTQPTKKDIHALEMHRHTIPLKEMLTEDRDIFSTRVERSHTGVQNAHSHFSKKRDSTRSR
jgi:hypothetical protein